MASAFAQAAPDLEASPIILVFDTSEISMSANDCVCQEIIYSVDIADRVGAEVARILTNRLQHPVMFLEDDASIPKKGPREHISDEHIIVHLDSFNADLSFFENLLDATIKTTHAESRYELTLRLERKIGTNTVSVASKTVSDKYTDWQGTAGGCMASYNHVADRITRSVKKAVKKSADKINTSNLVN